MTKKNSEDIVIYADNICKYYKMGDSTVKAVDKISLKIRRGEFISIVGPSGSGKTTLLDIISCLLRPDHGEVYINGHAISKMDDNELARIRGKTIGFVFQTFNLMPRLTALENVMLPLWFQNVPRAERERIAKELLKEVGLEARMAHKPSELSGGERQRVAIARALATDPDVIVADEPTGNLDSKAGQHVLDIIKKLHKEKGKTIVMVTHDLKISEMAERRIKLLDGKIIEDKILSAK